MNVEIYSKEKMETLLKQGFMKNTAVVAFYSPSYETPINYDENNNRFITLPVEDLDIDELEKYGYTIDSFFPEAQKAAEFIKKAVNDDMKIACQCEYGESRSAGCAAAIMEFYDKNGINVFADYRYLPNKIIFVKLLDALSNGE